MNKKIIITFLAFLAVYGLGSAEIAEAGTTTNPHTIPIVGQAYSPNTGYINFFCENGKSRPFALANTPENIDGCSSGVNYKVVYDTNTRNMSGTAYSENYGWIKFDGMSSSRVNGNLEFSGNLADNYNFGDTCMNAGSSAICGSSALNYKTVVNQNSEKIEGYMHSSGAGYVSFSDSNNLSNFSDNNTGSDLYQTYLDLVPPRLEDAETPVFQKNSSYTAKVVFEDITDVVSGTIKISHEDTSGNFTTFTTTASSVNIEGGDKISFTHNFSNPGFYHIRYNVCDAFGNCYNNLNDAITPGSEGYRYFEVTNDIVLNPNLMPMANSIKTANGSDFFTVSHNPSSYDAEYVPEVFAQVPDAEGDMYTPGYKDVFVNFIFENKTLLDQIDGNGHPGDATIFRSTSPSKTVYGGKETGELKNGSGGLFNIRVSSYSPTSDGYSRINDKGYYLKLVGVENRLETYTANIQLECTTSMAWQDGACYEEVLPDEDGKGGSPAYCDPGWWYCPTHYEEEFRGFDLSSTDSFTTTFANGEYDFAFRPAVTTKMRNLLCTSEVNSSGDEIEQRCEIYNDSEPKATFDEINDFGIVLSKNGGSSINNIRLGMSMSGNVSFSESEFLNPNNPSGSTAMHASLDTDGDSRFESVWNKMQSPLNSMNSTKTIQLRTKIDKSNTTNRSMSFDNVRTYLGYTIDGKYVSYYANEESIRTNNKDLEIVGSNLSNNEETSIANEFDKSVGDYTIEEARISLNKNLASVLERGKNASGDVKIIGASDEEFISSEGNPTTLNNKQILIINGDLTVGTNNTTLKTPSGSKTIVVNGGNIHLKSNLIYRDNKSVLGLIALKDRNGNGGNIYIYPEVTNAVGSVYAEGSVLSVPETWSTDIAKIPTDFSDSFRRANFANQLYWQGSIASQNTIGGSYSNPEKCPNSATSGCNHESAKAYDLSTLRYFYNQNGKRAGESTMELYGVVNIDLPDPPSALINDAVIVEYDSRLASNPPPLFSNSNNEIKTGETNY